MPAARRRAKTARKPSASPAAATVSAWQDDPGDPKTQPQNTPVTLPAPNLSAQPLASKISGKNPAPKIYQPGTAEFRFFAAATALRRTADFWGSIIGHVTWEIGNVLPVVLDDGEDLNAFYTRGGFGDGPGLHFFHDAVSGRTYFSGESPDVVCHEMGHAVLDAIRPELWDANTAEAAAFHESFGDMSAMLSALQLDSFRVEVLKETQGTLNRASRLSRLAEQLGAAIRLQHPDSVDADCLRNAANSFFYRDSQTLPPSAPATQLSSEPHSLSRVFTGAFLDLLAGMSHVAGSNDPSGDLLATSRLAAQILVAGIGAAPVAPDYFSQVAAHMIDAGEQPPFNGKYRDVLKGVFVRRGILSLSGAVTVLSSKRSKGARAPRAMVAARSSQLPAARISGSAYGLSDAALTVFTAGEPKHFAVTASVLPAGAPPSASPQDAAVSFTNDLFRRGHVDVGQHGHALTGSVHPFTKKTHVVVKEEGNLVLRRRMFDCGLRH